jgi:hypothetical protein
MPRRRCTKEAGFSNQKEIKHINFGVGAAIIKKRNSEKRGKEG